MRNFFIRHGAAILVSTIHEIPDHVFASFGIWIITPGLDNVHVSVCHPVMCDIPFSIAREGKAREKEIDGCESHIQVMVIFRKSRIQTFAYFFALQAAGCCEDDNFSHCTGDIGDAFGPSECRRVVEITVHFLFDQGNIRIQSFSGKAEFDELCHVSDRLLPFVCLSC